MKYIIETIRENKQKKNLIIDFIVRRRKSLIQRTSSKLALIYDARTTVLLYQHDCVRISVRNFISQKFHIKFDLEYVVKNEIFSMNI